MNAKLSSVVLLCIAMILLSSCSTAPLYNVMDTPINTSSGKPPTIEDVQKAILSAATTTKPAWSMKVIKSGHILGTLQTPSYTAMVDIIFNTKSYSILYHGGTNLTYDPEEKTIHHNYNGWIQNLDNAIKSKLSSV